MIQIYLDNAGDLELVAKNIESSGLNFLRYGDTFFEGCTCIVNVASDRDRVVFVAGIIQVELKEKRFLCRTVASFVSARIGIVPKDPISPHDLGVSRERSGGLIVIGSYVPKTTKQFVGGGMMQSSSHYMPPEQA